MLSRRVSELPGFSIDTVAEKAGHDPDVLRLENMDTDLPPPRTVIEATKAAVGTDDANSYLPFTGNHALCEAVCSKISGQTGHSYDPDENVVITNGLGEGILDTFLALLDPGDEIILTDPTYAGIICRARITSAVPRLAPFDLEGTGKLDINRLESLINKKTKAVLISSPAFPSCMVLDREEWEAIASLCIQHHIYLLFNSAMGRILFDDRLFIHPGALPGMEDLTITMGCVSKEYRMIGWRIGWVVGPATVMKGIRQVHIYNGLTTAGIAQAGALAALETEDEADILRCTKEWQKRRDVVLEQLDGMPIIPAQGGWCMLMNTEKMGHNPEDLSALLLEKGKIAATPMTHWGEVNGPQYLRFVFSNEPVQRLMTIRERFDLALKK